MVAQYLGAYTQATLLENCKAQSPNSNEFSARHLSYSHAESVTCFCVGLKLPRKSYQYAYNYGLAIESVYKRVS